MAALGAGALGWSVGDECTALLSGGGYAELVAVPVGQLMPVPDGLDLVTAAALPEVACTVWSNVVMDAGLRAGDVLLVHGGAGGIGTFAIQAAVALGARVAVTAGSAEKLERCRELGAEILVNYREQDFVEVVRARRPTAMAPTWCSTTWARPYLARNVAVLATGGRLQVIGMQGGTTGELDLGRLMATRGQVRATTLRARPVVGEGRDLRARRGRGLAARRARRGPAGRRPSPADDATLREAHRVVEGSEHVGKVVLVR